MPQGKGTYGSKVGRPPKKKTGMMYGGMASKKKTAMNKGGMPMGKDPKTGKMMPKFAMDGKGKMNMGGMAKKKMGMSKGGSPKKK
jgi:hypothetical protein